MGDKKIYGVFFAMCLATGMCTYWLTTRQHKKIGVVDAVKLFDQFNMKKEMEGREKVKLESIARQSDSLNTKLQVARVTKNEEEIKRLTYAYSYINQEMEKAYKQGNQNINVQVWKRLNPAVEEYGKQKGLHLIIGANGMGSVLYNDDYYDLTNELIKYVNKKYEEGS